MHIKHKCKIFTTSDPMISFLFLYLKKCKGKIIHTKNFHCSTVYKRFLKKGDKLNVC